MKNLAYTTLVFFAWVYLAGCASTSPAASLPPADTSPTVLVQMETTMGTIVLELDRLNAPVSTANFLRYVDENAYDGTIFHRVMENFVIQGGGHLPDMTELPGHEPIINEWNNGLKNDRGTIAMARETEPDSATRQWYINVKANPRLDVARDITGGAGYAVFGKVIKGMDVVDAIRAVPVTTLGESANVPVTPIVIESVKRVE